MTEATVSTIIVAVAGAIPATLVAWAGLQKSRQAAETAAVGVQQNTELIQKASEIKVATDGTNNSLSAALAVANERIAGLEKLVSSIAKKNGV